LSAEKAKAMVIATSITGTLRWMITYRTATTSIESPGSWNTDLEAGYHSTGEVNTGQLTLTVGSAMWVQLGVQYWSSTNGTLAASTLGIAVGVRKA